MDYIRKYWYIVLIVMVVFGFVVFTFTSGEVPNSEDIDWEESMTDPENEVKPEEVKEEEEPLPIFFIDIKGEVISPGVYEVKESDRVMDVVMMAGGFTEQAEQKGVNLAEKVMDEMVIYVPKQGEKPSDWTSIQAPLNDEKKLVDINVAEKVELETLPGIGPSKADAIIAYRQENGLFQSIEDLDKVSGFGEKSVESLREYVTIN
ncbi:helix-hairpin-helix domain-containing protein [Bacillus sp. DJP31]|uniref:helix-hairpin-helix domain-containing protein n=1 Tax=Bacillus sp. DJP31 TaxID=3409789 RepID=UPI003BB70876